MGCLCGGGGAMPQGVSDSEYAKPFTQKSTTFNTLDR